MNLDDITSGEVLSPADLIDLRESLESAPALRPPAPAPPPVRWAFRGQSQPFGTLVPSFQRIFGQKHPVGAAEIIERDLISTFRTHYASLEGKTSDMPQPAQIGEGYDLRCLSVMQHYGVPTRLLDWTGDFWTAVYFACAGDPSKSAELWMYDRDMFGPQLVARPDLMSLLGPGMAGPEPQLLGRRDEDLIVELDPQITPRMRRQAAHHTLSSEVFADHAALLFDMAANAPQTGTDSRFRRVLIAAPCKEKTLRFLADQLGTTAGSIFPDVEGLGKFLHWHLESLVTTIL